MVEPTEIQVPDITPFSSEEFLITFFDSGKQPVAAAEFSYTVDKGKTLTGTTDENGILRVRMKTPPPREITLSFVA